MHRRSKLRKKHTGISIFLLILLLLPFKDTIEYVFLSFSRNLMLKQRNYSRPYKSQKLELILKAKESQYLRQENKRLRKALGFKENKDINLIGVEIISFDPSSWRRVVVINAGKNKGLKKGLFAVNEEGWLIGKLSEVSGTYARLMFIEDADFTLPVFVGENAFGLLRGGLGGINILYLERDEDIKLKDKVWLKTPLLSYPLYIGEVSKIVRDESKLFLDVKVKLFSHNPLLNKIFIVK